MKVLSLVDTVEAEAKAEVDRVLPPHTEDQLARRLADENSNVLRFVAEWGKWVKLNPPGAMWSFDRTLFAFELARRICREEAEQTSDEKIKVALLSNKTVAAVVNLAKADRTPDGGVDLRDASLPIVIRPDAYMTKSTSISPAAASCSLWRRFLDRVTGDNRELAWPDYGEPASSLPLKLRKDAVGPKVASRH